MKRLRLHGLHDYLALLVRRRWWVAGSFVAFSALAVLFSMLFPKVFLSETMILIQPRDVPTEFVTDLIAGSTDERLSSIEQTVLSRTNLLRIFDEFGDRMHGISGPERRPQGHQAEEADQDRFLFGAPPGQYTSRPRASAFPTAIRIPSWRRKSRTAWHRSSSSRTARCAKTRSSARPSFFQRN